VAALALSAKPSLAAAGLVDVLQRNADDLGAAGFDSSFGWGRVNAFRAVKAAIPAKATIAVAVTPASAALRAGEIRQFTAAVSGSSAGVTWNVNPAVGSISATGVYTAPPALAVPQVVTVTATSIEDRTKSASATVSVGMAIWVAVTPPAAILGPSGTAQFTAAAVNSTQGVFWTITPQVGSISAAGFYTAPAAVTSAVMVSVRAVSVEDPSKAATASITLQPPPRVAVSINPGIAALGPGQTAQFAAAVTGANTGVIWSCTPAIGTISTGGLYTAPANVSASQTVLVTASVAGASATATVTLLPPPPSAPEPEGEQAKSPVPGRALGRSTRPPGGGLPVSRRM
jgi:hypothetical protein